MLAGNQRLKIYGRLNCFSGKRMKNENRVFFRDEEEAVEAGYRPCGHCFKKKYWVWKGKYLPVKINANGASSNICHV
jgi:methylphosphotriester-DNA--protein-cysteine methyltransferase